MNVKMLSQMGNDETRLISLTHDLFERVKELNCLYGISRLVENRSLSLDHVLQGVANLIPPAWQYPEITGARIVLKDRQFQTSNYRETHWQQAETINEGGARVGSLVVCYLREKPAIFEGPFLKEERELLHAIATRVGNIIENKDAETSLRVHYEREKKLHAKLRREMESRIEFSRKLIHELKTPLTSLMATSQLLVEETNGTRLGKVARYVWEGANRLNSRIEELHDVVKGEVGALMLKLKPVDIAQLLSTLVEENRAFSEQNGITISLELDLLPEKVMADPERVRQVVTNLLNNAYKYAREGKRVTIKTTLDLSAQVRIEVRDYGPGIPKDKQRILFKPGFQVRHDGETPGGMGIGLTLCKMLVELHGGKIWLESKLGKGASFFFTLPLAPKERGNREKE